MKDLPGQATLDEIASQAKYFALLAERNALRDALELAVTTIERIAVRHGPFSSADGTLSVARAALDISPPDPTPETQCDHNEMVATQNVALAWKCAKCGYVYGGIAPNQSAPVPQEA